MYMIPIFREGNYKLDKNSEGEAPYAIFKQTIDYDWCWIQVSKNYRSKGWAYRKLKQLANKGE